MLKDFCVKKVSERFTSRMPCRGRETEQLTVVNNLSRLMDLLTGIIYWSGYRAYSPDFIRTSTPSLHSNISIRPPLGSSDLGVIASLVNHTRQNCLFSSRHILTSQYSVRFSFLFL